MDFQELKARLSADTEYHFTLDEAPDVSFYLTLRKPTNAEHLEFRRRQGKISQPKHSKFWEASEEASEAPFWLLDRVKVKLECSNGSGDAVRETAPEDIWNDSIDRNAKMQLFMRHFPSLDINDGKKS